MRSSYHFFREVASKSISRVSYRKKETAEEYSYAGANFGCLLCHSVSRS
jgi:hypothetical protein